MNADFTQSFDARDWAEAFVKMAKAKPELATDLGTVHGFFANAIMRGFVEGEARAQKAAQDGCPCDICRLEREQAAKQ